MRQKTHYSVPFISIAIFLFTTLVVYSSKSIEFMEEVGTLPMIVPHIPVGFNSALLLFTAISFLLLVYLLLLKRKGVILDPFGYFLLLRLVFSIFQISFLSLNQDVIRFGNYYLYIIEFLFYLSIRNLLNSSLKIDILKIFKLFVFLVALQTIYQSVFGIFPSVNYLSTWYKANMNIPVGSSNSISAIILPFVIVEFFNLSKKTKFDILYLIVGITAVILTKSRWAIVLMIVGYLYSLKFNKTASSLLISLGVITLILYIVVNNFNDIAILLYGFSDSVDGSQIDKLSSGRISMHNEYLEIISNNFLIGFGPNYESSRAHNFVIDIIFQNGIIGFIAFMYAILFIFYNTKRRKYKKHIDNDVRYLLIVLSVFVIQSLGEISYFTDITCNVLFFSIYAILSWHIMESKTNKKTNNETQVVKI